MTDPRPDELGPAIPPASDQPVEAIGAGREEIDLYDDKVQEGIAWTMRQWGEALGLETWTQGDGSESVEGDVGAEIHTILVDAGLRDPETNEMAALSPASPARTPMGEPVAWIERQNDGTRYGEPKRWPPSDRARSYAQEMGRTIEPLYAAASPARTPMGGPQVLKGVGKINGDGWKDTTTIGEVVYVWNAEKPSPYAPGQYPRIWNEGWSASTAQYDFSPASIDEVRALAAPTPMGRKVEAKWAGDSNVLRVGWLVEVLASDPLPAEIINGHQMPRLPGRTACWVRFWPNGRDAPIYRSCDLNDLELSDEAFEALAASSPSPAQGGEAVAWREPSEPAPRDGRWIVTINKYRGVEAIRWSSETSRLDPEARERGWVSRSGSSALSPERAVAWCLAPPSVQPVEGK